VPEKNAENDIKTGSPGPPGEELLVCERALGTSERKLSSMLELGRLIGLDLNLDDMLIQIASKAKEVLEADRFNILLYDPRTDELWTKMVFEIEGREFRTPSHVGLSGYAFHTGQTVNVEDAHEDPRFFRYIEEAIGYTTKSILCMPFFSRSGAALGVMQLINKREGRFTAEDEALLRMFTNHASVFIEIAQLQKERMDTLEESRRELERLNKAKGKALDHLSHELKTPLALIQGYLRILKRKISKEPQGASVLGYFDTLKHHMTRFSRCRRNARRSSSPIARRRRRTSLTNLRTSGRRSKGWTSLSIPGNTGRPSRNASPITSPRRRIGKHAPPLSVVQKTIADARANAPHRDIEFRLAGDEETSIFMDVVVVRDMMAGLLKNAVENTPDGGLVEVSLKADERNVTVAVRDYGMGSPNRTRSTFSRASSTLRIPTFTARRTLMTSELAARDSTSSR
jgi:signal transduction histidine kinase